MEAQHLRHHRTAMTSSAAKAAVAAEVGSLDCQHRQLRSTPPCAAAEVVNPRQHRAATVTAATAAGRAVMAEFQPRHCATMEAGVTASVVVAQRTTAVDAAAAADTMPTERQRTKNAEAPSFAPAEHRKQHPTLRP